VVDSSTIFLTNILAVSILGLSFYKWGLKAMGFLIPFLVVSILGINDYIGFLPTVLAGGIVGAIAGFSFREKKSLQFYLLASSLFSTLVVAVVFLYLSVFKSTELIAQLKNYFLTTINNPQFSSLDSGVKEFVKIALDSIELNVMIIPFAAFWHGVFWTLIGYFVMKIVFAFVVRKRFIMAKGLEYFRLNDYLIFGLIGCLIGLVFIGYKDNMALFVVLINCLVVIVFFYFIQTIGIMRYFILAKKLPTFLLPLFFFVLAYMGREIFIVSIVMLAGWGALDLWTDFRKLNKPEESTDSNES
jgi:hypothetical protein